METDEAVRERMRTWWLVEVAGLEEDEAELVLAGEMPVPPYLVWLSEPYSE